MPTYSHNLQLVFGQLGEKIAQLESKRSEIEAKVKAGIGVSMNTDALKQINASLAHAYDARTAIQSSCCNQNCDIEWQDA